MFAVVHLSFRDSIWCYYFYSFGILFHLCNEWCSSGRTWCCINKTVFLFFSLLHLRIILFFLSIIYSVSFVMQQSSATSDPPPISYTDVFLIIITLLLLVCCCTSLLPQRHLVLLFPLVFCFTSSMSDVPQAGHGVLSCLLLPEVFYFFFFLLHLRIKIFNYLILFCLWLPMILLS